jgi:hypothetical protein
MTNFGNGQLFSTAARMNGHTFSPTLSFPWPCMLGTLSKRREGKRRKEKEREGKRRKEKEREGKRRKEKTEG